MLSDRRTHEEVESERDYLTFQYCRLMEEHEECEDELEGDSDERAGVMNVIVSKCRRPGEYETSLDYSRRLWSKVKKKLRSEGYDEYLINGAKEFIRKWFNEGWWLD